MIDTSLQSVQKPATRRVSPFKLGCGLVAIILLVVVALGVFKAIRIAPAARGLLTDLRALQAVDLGSLSDPDPAQLTRMRDQFASLEANLATVQREAGPFLPLTQHLGWLPRVGGEAQAAPLLLEIASGVATAGRTAMDGGLPVLAAIQTHGEGDALSRALPALVEAQPLWQEAEAALLNVEVARSQLDLGALQPVVAQQVERLDGYLPLLRAGMSMARMAPLLLGYDEPRTYLVLAQNSDELRPSGGFISGVGLVTLDKGRITELSFQDSYWVYDGKVDHPPAPAALERYMKAQMLLLRDANWSADFPTTAAVAQSLYLLDTGRQTDGVVAIDLETTRRIVQAIEPLTLPGYSEALTSRNLIAALRAVWAAPSDTELTASADSQAEWWRHRKDFMGDLATAAKEKLEAGRVNYPRLALAFYGVLQEKHMLINLRNRAANDLMASMNWDGALRPGDQDYLLVVDTNVGWNKVNAVVNRDMKYQVALIEGALPQATLEMTYRHGGKQSDEPCVHVTPAYGNAYDALVHRCYFDYLRVYALAGARLIEAEGFEADTVAAGRGERNTTVFEGFLVVPPGGERQVRLSYELPASVVDDATYKLRVQKQPGTPAWPLQVALLDSAARWLPVSAGGVAIDGGVSFSLTLDADLEVVARRVP